MMKTGKLRIVIPFAAFGVAVAYLGYEWSLFGSGLSSLLLVFALAMAAAGGAALPGIGRRSAGGAASVKDDAGSSRRDGDVAALVGHEMKNYLCALKGNARLLRDRINDGNDKAIMDRIDRAVEKLESFTRNMNVPASATSNRHAWRMRLGDEAKSCVAMHFLKDAERFKWELAEGAVEFLGDPDRMEQVFLNLYANALEAGASQIATSVFRCLDRLEVRIEDDGPGCAPADLIRIFEPFFTTKPGPARRGLGMFIVQSIVENHGGRIRVRSKNSDKGEAHGLVFTLDFPLTVPVGPGKGGPGTPGPAPLRREERWLLALPEPI
jgi:signal transduction histidine kinase